MKDWYEVFGQYNRTSDLQEQHKYLEALTFTRLPFLLTKFLENDVKLIDFFDVLKLYGQNTVGREIAWLYYRRYFEKILEQYGLDDPDVGQALVDITRTFDSEFLFFELLKFVVNTPSGAELNSRFKALEIVSTNIAWLLDHEAELIDAFTSPRKQTTKSFVKTSDSFKENVKNWLKNRKQIVKFH